MDPVVCTYQSELLGPLSLVASDEGLLACTFAKDRYSHLEDYPQARPVEAGEHPVLAVTCDWLDRYFAGENPAIEELPLAPEGTEFRQAVWMLLREIPYGQTVTYGELAARMALQRGVPKMSARAVGGAVGRNPIGLIVPCHRVVGADGSLTGFGGGIPAKVALLQHEGCDMSRFTIPTKGTAL